MGFIKIKKSDDDTSVYVYFKIEDDVLEILTMNLAQEYFSLRLTQDSETVKEWSSRLNKTPEDYFKKFSQVLEKVSGNEKEFGSKNKDFFEIDFENRFVWKKYLLDKKIVGAQGKFKLNRVKNNQNQNQFDIFMSAVFTEFNNIKSSSKNLTEQNKQLFNSCKELEKISQECVDRNKKFEDEVYSKFTLILNSKKRKNAELRDVIKKLKDSQNEQSAKNSDKKSTDDDLYDVIDSDYDADTDDDDDKRYFVTDDEKSADSGDDSGKTLRQIRCANKNAGEKSTRTIDEVSRCDGKNSRQMEIDPPTAGTSKMSLKNVEELDSPSILDDSFDAGFNFARI